MAVPFNWDRSSGLQMDITISQHQMCIYLNILACLTYLYYLSGPCGYLQFSTPYLLSAYCIQGTVLEATWSPFSGAFPMINGKDWHFLSKLTIKFNVLLKGSCNNSRAKVTDMPKAQ